MRRLGGVVLCALFGLLYGAGPVAAAGTISFGTPSATSKFGVGIQFTQPYSGGTIKSADLLVTLPGDIGPSVAPLDTIGTSSLVYSMDTSTSGMYPNTPVVAHFEVVLDDGSVQDGPNISITYADDRYTWHVVVGKVVRIHYIQATDAFAQQMLTWGENGLQKAARFFGVTETKPVDFFVYPSEAVFQQGLSQAGTIGGVTLSAFRTCFAAVTPGDSAYGQSVIPHELTHIAFADASDSPYHNPPRWFNEGLAVYMSDGYDSSDRQLVSQAVKNGTLRSLLAYSDYFPLDASRIYLAYAESVSAIDYMVRKYGQPAVAKIVRTYATGTTDDEAFKAGIGIGVAAFNAAWLTSVGVAPTQYGPKPAPTGPVPPGWNGTSPGSVTTPQPGATGPGAVTGTPQPTAVPGQTSSTPVDDQSAYGVAGLIALAGFLLLGLAWLLSVESGARVRS
jgi:Peptidase MA superfamily